MQAHDDRDQFTPPRPPARLRAITLAVLVHLVLIVALTWGVNWKNSADQPAVEAELWAAVPTQAAPRAIEPPTPPALPPRPVPVTPPAPPVRAVQPPDTTEADIAIEREKKRLEQEKKERQQQLEREKRERERKEDERRERLEQEKKERLQKEKAEQQKAEREKERLEKLDKQKQLADDKKRQAQEAQRKQEALEKASAQAAEARRQENIRRMQGLAGATGGENAAGTALRNSGPSGSYGGRVAAAVKPNIVFTESVVGNPLAEVEVRTAPDGTIVQRKLIKSSGNKAWDEAVLRALDKTERLPRDVNGLVPPQFPISFRPKD